jgi:hypothetical protein
MPTALPVVFFDDGRGESGPLTDLRPSFDVRTGALTMAERVRRQYRSPLYAWMAGAAITPLRKDRTDLAWIGRVNLDCATLLINGRCPLVPESVWSLAPDHAIVEAATRELVAAHVSKPGNIRAAAAGDLSALTVVQHEGHVLLART